MARWTIPARKELAEEIRTHQAVHLVRMVPFMIFGNVLAMMASVLNAPHVVFDHYVYVPYIALLVLMLPMLWNWRRYADRPWPESVSPSRVNRASQHTFLVGLTWAVACAMTFPFLNPREQSMYVGIIGVMMVGGASGLSRVPMAGLCFGLPLGAVLLVCGFAFDHTTNRVVSFGVLMALIAYTLVLRYNWHAFVEHVRADTGQRKLEGQLAAQRIAAAAQQHMIEAVPFPLILSHGETPLFASPNAAEVFGLVPQDMAGGTLSLRQFFVDEGAFMFVVEQHARGEAVERFETQFLDAHKRPFWALLSSRPVEYNDQPAWLNAILPIDERKKAEQELAVAKEAAERASNAKTDFLASMSHELRTPLNAIIGYSEILLEDAEEDGNETYAEDLRRIRVSGRHILALINDILDITKIEAGKMEITPEHVTVGDLVSDVVVVIRRLMDKNGNHFTVENLSSVDTLWTDVTKTRQTVLNLLSNASKFTSEGKIVLRVESEKRGEEDWLLFSVTDTGIGIPLEQLEHIFEEFNRGDSNSARHVGGTGLGLALSRRIARLLGGDITVTSTPGRGSCFTFSLPARIDAEELL